MQIVPLVVNILKKERKSQAELDDEGYLHTNAPEAVFKIFNEYFEMIRMKKLTKLILRVLRVMQEITEQYQRALKELVKVINGGS